MDDVVIRLWRPDDDPAAMDVLLDAEPDPYWLLQRNGVYGIGPRTQRFAVTLVAHDRTGIVGGATFYESRYHPGHYMSTIEVVPRRRLHGIGRQLLTDLLDRRPAPKPLQVKLRDANETATRFAAAVGMRTLQHCPVASVDPADPLIRLWSAEQVIPVGARVSALGPVDVVDAMVEFYEWVHALWSPMGDRDVITELWAEYVRDADPQLSSIAMVGDRVAAVSLVWIQDGRADGVAETIRRDQRDGVPLVAACIARTLRQLDRIGSHCIEFDGHDDDPHFIPVLDSMPRVDRDPVSLLELT